MGKKEIGFRGRTFSQDKGLFYKKFDFNNKCEKETDDNNEKIQPTKSFTEITRQLEGEFNSLRLNQNVYMTFVNDQRYNSLFIKLS